MSAGACDGQQLARRGAVTTPTRDMTVSVLFPIDRPPGERDKTIRGRRAESGALSSLQRDTSFGRGTLAVTPYSKLYRDEARKLYALADAFPFGEMRNEFIDIARQYEALARHAEITESRTTTEMSETSPGVVPFRLAPER